MVWIKVNDTIYYNSELIASIYITSYEETNNIEVSIVCKYSETKTDDYGSYPSVIELWSSSFKPKVFVEPNSYTLFAGGVSSEDLNKEDIDYEGTYNENMREQLLEKAKEILVKLLNEFDAANKNGNVIFDLEAFPEPYTINN